ncbi:MAG: bifunctional (p)ppGpp synthetase/guanosine-3',5'-bis(diphosphate) 3'-pyrophosphohydrolase [Comamonadaceae bacterium]|nr:bifunctional (p)ppGpp synthetase/guanosine-3',5'-bis(diphosphate) 3'-pyrophosphohydrolase [Comamonadaceae bacterium]
MKSAIHADGSESADAGGILAVASQGLPSDPQVLARARAFAQPLVAGRVLDTGEPILAHADAVAAILDGLGGSQAMQAASYLVYACEHLNKPAEVIAAAFGQSHADLAVATTKLVNVQRQARLAQAKTGRVDEQAAQTETVRKMLLAFSRDLRVVMLRLASRLQTLRYYASTRREPSSAMAQESMHVFAPLANRLGIWQIKWELEDLAFRFTEPQTYRDIAKLLDEKRLQREGYMQALCAQLQAQLRPQGLEVTVQGRPKHIYSIVRKMRGKALGFDQVFDVRALRVIAPDVKACYAVLAHVHERFSQVEGEFDDYIARPKANGYQSLHTVVRDHDGKAIEIQIRTPAMHEHAESGVAAHWAYKEAGSKGYAGVSAAGPYDAKIAVLRQLLAWEREMSEPLSARDQGGHGLLDDRIYVLTPEAAVVELARGSTAVDFAYSLHTTLGHRCRGARVDAVMVPLNTVLRNGQTVEIIAAKEGGPSRDWLNPELGFLASPRARAKVRAWFNALALQETVARGREAVEKLLQREGKTAVGLDELAVQLGFKAAEDLFEVVGKDEFSLRTIENMLRPSEPAPSADDLALARMRSVGQRSTQGGVLVVGVDSLLTQLAKCCKPAPPDAIRGFVTRGKGVSIHRSDCSNFRNMAGASPERVIEVKWNDSAPALYPVDIAIEAADRQGLLRDISEVFSREKVNVVGVQTQSLRDHHGDSARMTFTVEVADSRALQRVLAAVAQVSGVRLARRR